MSVATKLTIEDFERLPDALAYYHELVDGELVDVSGNTPSHSLLRDYLIELLRPHCRQHRLGKVISEQEYQFGDNAHGPDVTFLRPAKADRLDPHRRVQLMVPDLAIEIVSKNDTFAAMVGKARHYLHFGTEEVWLFFIPTREVYFYSPAEDSILRDHEMFESSLLPGFRMRIDDLYDQA